MTDCFSPLVSESNNIDDAKLFSCTQKLNPHPCKKCNSTSNCKRWVHEHFRHKKQHVIHFQSHANFSSKTVWQNKCIKTNSKLCFVKHTQHCKTCGENVPTSITQSQIVDTKDSAWHYCLQCSYKCKQKVYLHIHELVKHANVDTAQWFTCDKCSFQTKRMKTLKLHERQSHQPKTVARHLWFNCDQCSFWTLYKHNLKQHMMRHASSDEQRWFNCFHCSYKTKHKSYFNKHMFQHDRWDEQGWFSCDKCSHKCKQKSYLTEHYTIHHAQKLQWYCCDKCPYRAKVKQDLTKHKIQHVNPAETFNCDKCTYRAKLKQNLKSHMWKQHGVLPANILNNII